jgi:ribosomal protein L37AE/L43A
MECSINYRVFACKQCGMIAIVNPEKNIHTCRNCKNSYNFSEIHYSPAAKLFKVQTMGIQHVHYIKKNLNILFFI